MTVFKINAAKLKMNGNEYTFMGSNSVKMILLTSDNGLLEKENSIPTGNNFFPFRLGSFSEGLGVQEKRKSQKFFSFSKMKELHIFVLF